MVNNVSEALESRATTLFERLVQNDDLSNVIMGFLGRIIVMCHKAGKPIQGVDTGEVVSYDEEFRFAVTFNDLVLTPMGLWQPQRDLLNYAASRSVHLARALERNPKMIKTFTSLVEAVERYCDRNRIAFRDFKLKKSFIHPKTNTCVIRAGKPELKDRFR